jgi:RNA polymerase sigma-70 factor (ECF subfamily)
MGALRSFALQLCKDEQYSHDLVQETMLKAYLYFHTYREGTNCRAWLFQICKNSYINEVRRRKHQPMLLDLQGEESGDWSRGSDDSPRELHVTLMGDTASDTLGDEVYRALTLLPPDYQTALILCDIEGHTYEEIAEFVNAPIGTVRSRIHRGRKLLAGYLQNYAVTQGFLRASHLRPSNN